MHCYKLEIPRTVMRTRRGKWITYTHVRLLHVAQMDGNIHRIHHKAYLNPALNQQLVEAD